jgi:hypothetical protein
MQTTVEKPKRKGIPSRFKWLGVLVVIAIVLALVSVFLIRITLVCCAFPTPTLIP